MYKYKATIRSIYDGDTIRADIELGFGVDLKNVPLKLAGLNAPEIRNEERSAGLLTKHWLMSQIPQGTEVTIKTEKISGELFGTYHAIVFMGSLNINEQMITLGLAEEFEIK